MLRGPTLELENIVLLTGPIIMNLISTWYVWHDISGSQFWLGNNLV